MIDQRAVRKWAQATNNLVALGKTGRRPTPRLWRRVRKWRRQSERWVQRTQTPRPRFSFTFKF
jgi:hypothetical protein